MEKSRIIALDIDGVLNHAKFFMSPEYLQTGSQLDEKCVKLLNQLDGAMVLVTSSWGENGGKTAEELQMAGLELPIIGYTKKLHYQFEWACRGNEIEEWVLRTYGGMGTHFGSEYDSEDYEYVIFDDDQDMLLGQAEHFIHVDREIGLTQTDIDKAKKILKYDNCG